MATEWRAQVAFFKGEPLKNLRTSSRPRTSRHRAWSPTQLSGFVKRFVLPSTLLERRPTAGGAHRHEDGLFPNVARAEVPRRLRARRPLIRQAVQPVPLQRNPPPEPVRALLAPHHHLARQLAVSLPELGGGEQRGAARAEPRRQQVHHLHRANPPTTTTTTTSRSLSESIKTSGRIQGKKLINVHVGWGASSVIK